MGEIAEMMLDGTLCEACGVYLGDDEDFEPQGFPGYCSAECARSRGFVCDDPTRQPDKYQVQRTVSCTLRGCNRKFVTVEAMQQHARDKHGAKPLSQRSMRGG